MDTIIYALVGSNMALIATFIYQQIRLEKMAEPKKPAPRKRTKRTDLV